MFYTEKSTNYFANTNPMLPQGYLYLFSIKAIFLLKHVFQNIFFSKLSFRFLKHQRLSSSLSTIACILSFLPISNVQQIDL